MNTTNLFVELIVIGVGATLWIVLLILSLFGYAWVPFDGLLSLPALIPILSVIYVLGIVVDRLADALFEQIWKEGLLARVYMQANRNDQYRNDRRLLYTESDRLADLLEYGRSRLRICRGWVVNSVLILVAMNLFIWLRLEPALPRLQVSLGGSGLLFLLILGLWLSWRHLVLTDYRKTKDQAQFLRDRNK